MVRFKMGFRNFKKNSVNKDKMNYHLKKNHFKVYSRLVDLRSILDYVFSFFIITLLG